MMMQKYYKGGRIGNTQRQKTHTCTRYDAANTAMWEQNRQKRQKKHQTSNRDETAEVATRQQACFRSTKQATASAMRGSRSSKTAARIRHQMQRPGNRISIMMGQSTSIHGDDEHDGDDFLFTHMVFICEGSL